MDLRYKSIYAYDCPCAEFHETHTCSVMFCKQLLHLISRKPTKRLAFATELQTERQTAPQCKAYFIS